MTSRTTRRRFVQTLAAGAAAGSLSASGWLRAAGASERLRVASIGTGGKGWSDVTSVAKGKNVEIVAICDVDESKPHLGRAAETFPSAKRYRDWRRLLDDSQSIDAVIVSTPDHMHAPIAMSAIQLKKHVFCQKPLTHTVFEARQLTLAARRAGVVTQMGNQMQSAEFYRAAVRLVHDGAIGKVKEVHSWQSGAMKWLVPEGRPEGSDPIPETLNWNDWLGVAPERPYKDKIYHPFSWRGWQDFSNGQLGDFGCHILDPIFMAVGLSAPRQIWAESPPFGNDAWYSKSKVHYEFPGNQRTADATLRVTWYDGQGHMPSHEVLELPTTTKLPAAGSLVKGTEGMLLIPHGTAMPKLLPEARFADHKLPDVGKVDHYTSWADACRGEGKTTSNFDYAGPLTETVLLGTVAIRSRGEKLDWDSTAMRITNSSSANDLLTKRSRSGWEVKWS